MSDLQTIRTNVFAGLAEQAGATFTENEADVAINREYEFLQTLINQKNDEYFAKQSITSTTTNELYTFPTDLIKLLLIELKLNNVWYEVSYIPTWKKEAYKVVMNFDTHGPVARYYIVGNTYGLVPVRSKAGSQDLRLTYVYICPSLSANTDVPLLPSIYHELLEIGAVNRLRKAIKEPPINEADYSNKIEAMLNTIGPRVKHRPRQIRMVPGLY